MVYPIRCHTGEPTHRSADLQPAQEGNKMSNKMNWPTLFILLYCLSYFAYAVIWVAVGDLAPLWLRVFITIVIGLGVALMIITNATCDSNGHLTNPETRGKVDR